LETVPPVGGTKVTRRPLTGRPPPSVMRTVIAANSEPA
jgi:hypothetical protein